MAFIMLFLDLWDTHPQGFVFLVQELAYDDATVLTSTNIFVSNGYSCAYRRGPARPIVGPQMPFGSRSLRASSSRIASVTLSGACLWMKCPLDSTSLDSPSGDIELRSR